MSAPRRLLHLGFLTSQSEAVADREALAVLCAAHGVSGPAPEVKHHRALLGSVGLRWEQHTEFTTYTWEFQAPDSMEQPAVALLEPIVAGRQPGPLLVAVDLRLMGDGVWEEVAGLLDPAALAVSHMDGGIALAASDFKADADGFVRILMLDRGMADHRAGALAQRLLELETYRMLALLGLPEAQRLAPLLRGIEDELPAMTRAIMSADGFAANRALLDQLIALAAQLEADVTAALYRFGASRAYHDIVRGRLEAIDETPVPGHSTFAAFLSRRLSPAMRTCTTLQERQAALSQKLARAAQLLTAKVEVELEGQNRDLLSTMNKRTHLQLRLQQTVEGLSVAAVTYYVLGILGYVLKGLHTRIHWIDPELGGALAAPAVALVIALVVLRIRRQHAD
jgi:uncharacterized membrane-anchored protein